MHGPNAEKKEKPERATGLGGITREQIEKWNRMTDLRFQTEGVGGDIRSARPPFGPL